MTNVAWLNGPAQPRIFGDYELIRRDYPIQEFIKDSGSQGVTASVYVQVNWPNGEDVSEAAWVQATADKFGWPNAIIGHVDFASDQCCKVLSDLAKIPLMRGIRQQIHWHQNPQYCFAVEPDIVLNSNWRRNFALLQDYNWCFELQVFASQMRNAAKLAAEFRETPMILQHCGMPEDNSITGMAFWLEGIKFLADQPNVFCKFSGLGTFLRQNSTDFISDVTGHCLELFGANRCIYGSNFPIEKIWTPYSNLINSYFHSLSGLSRPEQKQIFYSNAKEVYKINI